MKDQLTEWFDVFKFADREKLERDTQKNIGALNRQAQLFFDAWLKSVGL
jgi:hypothetical protein